MKTYVPTTKKVVTRSVASEVQRKGFKPSSTPFVDNRSKQNTLSGLIGSNNDQVMNGRVSQNDAVQTMAIPPKQTSAPIQRMKFKYVSSKVKPTKTIQEKLDQIVPMLTKVVSHFGSDKATVKLKLINQGGMSPAFSNHDFAENDDYTGDVLVTLNKWYAQRASVGDIMGMLVHELGVHNMADFEMGAKLSSNKERLIADKGSPILEERNTEKKDDDTSKLGLKKGPHTMKGIDRNKSDRRQEDHVNVGKGLITGKAKSRAEVYTKTFLKAGDAINNNTKVGSKTRQQQLRDLIESFLFDIARIIATDDGKALAMFSKTEAIAELMNHYHNEIAAKHRDRHSWLKSKALQVSASKWGLRGKLISLIGQLILSSNPSVQKAKGIMGGSLVTLATYIGGTALVPALGYGVVAGGTIWVATKLWERWSN